MTVAQNALSRLAAVVIAAAAAAIAGIGGLATDTESEWYRSLELPSWQPPGAVFGPVWTVIYVLAGTSAFLAWRDVSGSRRRPVLALYAGNGILNAALIVICFGDH